MPLTSWSYQSSTRPIGVLSLTPYLRDDVIICVGHGRRCCFKGELHDKKNTTCYLNSVKEASIKIC